MMKHRISLGVSFLSGFLTFCTCVLNHFFYFSSLKTWGEAQTYCRQKYTDLATFTNMADMNLLSTVVSSNGGVSGVWIGLICGFEELWSDLLESSTLNWEDKARNDSLFAYHFCGSASKDGIGYEHWSVKHAFICQNGTQLFFVNETVDWFTAWKYCRENFTDLTTPSSPLWNSSQNGSWFTAVHNFVPSGYQAWIGIYEYPFSFWSDGSSSSFRYWDDFQVQYNWSTPMYGIADMQRSGKWRFVPNGEKLPFVCHNISPLPVSTSVPQVERKTEKVFKLRMSSSVDLNDPAVKTNILTQLQNRLKEKGVSGVSLKWKEMPDGKDFHKEEKTNVTHDEC